jgi:hypothetical protein
MPTTDQYIAKFEKLSTAVTELTKRYATLTPADKLRLPDLSESCHTLTECCRAHAAIDAHLAAKAAPAKPTASSGPKPMEFANALEKCNYRVPADVVKMKRSAFDKLPMEAKNDFMSRGGKLI